MSLIDKVDDVLLALKETRTTPDECEIISSAVSDDETLSDVDILKIVAFLFTHTRKNSINLINKLNQYIEGLKAAGVKDLDSLEPFEPTEENKRNNFFAGANLGV